MEDVQAPAPLYEQHKAAVEEAMKQLTWWADYWKERAYYWHKRAMEAENGR